MRHKRLRQEQVDAVDERLLLGERRGRAGAA